MKINSSIIEDGKDVCKNCFEPKDKHLDSGLVKNWDCPKWTGEHGGRHFEKFLPSVEKKEGPQTEKKISEFDTLKKIIEQLEFCEYEAVGGPLKNNIAFIALKRMAEPVEEVKAPVESKTKKPIHAKPQLYAYYFLDLKEIAMKHGYNLVVHGSMNRDLDLVAIPWTNAPTQELDLIHDLHMHMTGTIAHESHWREVYMYSELPGGRHSYVINLNRGGYRKDKNDEIADPIEFVKDAEYYIDISVTPFVSPAPVKDEEQETNTAWPLTSVLEKLIKATEILFARDYDGLGYEEIKAALTEAKVIHSKLSTSLPSESQEEQSNNFDDIMDFHRQGRSKTALLKVFTINRKSGGKVE